MVSLNMLKMLLLKDRNHVILMLNIHEVFLIEELLHLVMNLILKYKAIHLIHYLYLLHKNLVSHQLMIQLSLLNFENNQFQNVFHLLLYNDIND